MISTEQSILAIVDGKPLADIPHDLFIPPDALEVLLDSFSGPLDLLLYLIRRQNIDILNIPITQITQQYMQYITLMKERRLELAADYLVMAAVLAEIKSRMLLPPKAIDGENESEEDPRTVLVKRLQIYERFKEAAIKLDELPQCERDVHPVSLSVVDRIAKKNLPDINLKQLAVVMKQLIQRQSRLEHHQIVREALSVRDRMNDLLQKLQEVDFAEFSTLLVLDEGRMGVVVTLLAILELSRQSLLVVIQNENFAPIHIKAAANG